MGPSEGYDDLVGMVISETHRLDPGDLASGTQRWENEYPITIPRNSGLKRNEVAELVGIQLRDHDIWFRQTSGSGTTPATVSHEVQGGYVGDIPDNVLRNTDVEDDAATGATDRVITRSFETEKVPLYSRVTAQRQFNDTVNATGGGGSNQASSGSMEMLNLREFGGMGPLIFPEGPEWWHEFELNNHDNDDIGIDVKVHYMLLFEVWERSEVIELVDV